MPTHLLALVPWMALTFADIPGNEDPPGPTARPEAQVALGTSGGLRTDRLSRKQLQAWNKIVEIVLAEGGDHQPLHPTLRQLWDTVDRSGHVVYVEMPRRKSYIAGRFAITRVDPEGKAHEGILIVNLRAIDNASTGPGSARADGFIPFKGLGKKQRYAELLGHELAHAAWTLAEPERTRLVMPLQSENERLMQQWVQEAPGSDALLRRVNELERLSRMLEESAEAAEVKIWEELLAGQRLR